MAARAAVETANRWKWLANVLKKVVPADFRFGFSGSAGDFLMGE
jgi:hypothetical protein